MRDTNLVNALREHAEWWEYGDMMDPPAGLEKDLAAAADRLENQSAHIAALQQEIEKLRGQNEQLRGAAALVAKESAELLEQRWIPVEERLPEYGVRVLATDMYEGDDYTGIRTREEYPDDTDGCWYDEWGRWYPIDDATHWMPLPKAPEVKL